MAARGRPPVIEKAELPLSDGSVILLRLVGDGKTAQIELPDQWTLASLERAPADEGGRTRLSFVSTKRGKARGARAPKAETPTPTPTPRKRAPAKKAAAAPAAKKAAPAKKAAAPRRTRKTAASSSTEAKASLAA